jgi:hypothetical protein
MMATEFRLFSTNSAAAAQPFPFIFGQFFQPFSTSSSQNGFALFLWEW